MIEEPALPGRCFGTIGGIEEEKAQHAHASHRDVGRAVRLIAETLLRGLITVQNELHGMANLFLGDIHADALGGAEGEGVPTGEGEIAVAGLGFVKPSAGLFGGLGNFLGREDHLHGAGESGADLDAAGGIGLDAGDFGQRQGDDAVAVHPAAIDAAEVAIIGG